MKRVLSFAVLGAVIGVVAGYFIFGTVAGSRVSIETLLTVGGGAGLGGALRRAADDRDDRVEPGGVVAKRLRAARQRNGVGRCGVLEPLALGRARCDGALGRAAAERLAHDK